MSAFTEAAAALGQLEPVSAEDLLAMNQLREAFWAWEHTAHLRALTVPELKGRMVMLKHVSKASELPWCPAAGPVIERGRITAELRRRELGGGLMPKGWIE